MSYRILVPSLLFPIVIFGLCLGGTFIASEIFGILHQMWFVAPLILVCVVGICVWMQKQLNYSWKEFAAILGIGVLFCIVLGYFLFQAILKNFN